MKTKTNPMFRNNICSNFCFPSVLRFYLRKDLEENEIFDCWEGNFAFHSEIDKYEREHAAQYAIGKR